MGSNRGIKPVSRLLIRMSSQSVQLTRLTIALLSLKQALISTLLRLALAY
jgi:hypothetical protein